MRECICTIAIILFSQLTLAQSIDDAISQRQMVKDLEIFKNIRTKANSGLYKYRTKKEIDSMYVWAAKEIEEIDKYREFYMVICKLTDFEGSRHNSTVLSEKHKNSLKAERKGYFPYAIKWIDGKWLLNQEN